MGHSNSSPAATSTPSRPLSFYSAPSHLSPCISVSSSSSHSHSLSCSPCLAPHLPVSASWESPDLWPPIFVYGTNKGYKIADLGRSTGEWRGAGRGDYTERSPVFGEKERVGWMLAWHDSPGHPPTQVRGCVCVSLVLSWTG